MENWKVAICDPHRNEGAQFFLLNNSKTLVKVNRRSRFDPQTLFKRLSDLRFPFKYTEGLDLIHFTFFQERYNAMGDYWDGKIRINISQSCIDSILETFMHEVGHHVDEKEGQISSFLKEERKKRAKHLHEKFSANNEDEYLATGFEKFYAEDFADRRQLRKNNPLLYRTIQMLHRDYKRK